MRIPTRHLAVFLLLLVTMPSCLRSAEVKKKQMEDSRDLGGEYLLQKKYTVALGMLLEAEGIYPDDALLQNLFIQRDLGLF